ncbi:hypothetical protein DICVIV_12513 [Dictyocaulus viviparus]|uniref:Uncharacterized protein n=1 Tax=Dictyocaulus viviparus TaxID=29172 RepID=A0A0D8XA88_DICVI|nr:hypothetical protein DICVIV_12513 [Dictyocaulus viviparus]
MSNAKVDNRCRLEKNRSSIGGQPDYSSHDGYTPMHAAERSATGSNNLFIVPTYERYKLEEVRSYVSDSSESCYSSIAANGCSISQTSSVAANPPRAYSFAGRCNIRSTKHQDNVQDNVDLRSETSSGGVIPPSEDPRKRAFSLGSKTLFPRPFRKISQHSSRQQRHSQTSASGVSLASSEVSSSFGPSSSSANYLTSFSCSEKEEGLRNRSGSFGSGHSTSYNRRGSSGGPRDGADHFVEMDFGSGIGRSGSGSVASVESPNRRVTYSCVRSRTSSFGCSIRKDTEMFSYLTDLPDSLLTPSQLVLQQARQGSLDDSFDYVSTDAPDLNAVKNALAVATHEHSNGHHHNFLSTADSKSIDVRSSQHFETIEENASLKSSLSSSRSSLSVDVEAVEERETNRCIADSSGEIDNSRWNTRLNASALTSSLGSCCTPSDRSTSNPLYEMNELHPFQNFAHGIPKRSSVPVLKTHDADDSTTVFNYTFVQKAGPQMTDLRCDSWRPYRSKSGIIFSHNLDIEKSVIDHGSVKRI